MGSSKMKLYFPVLSYKKLVWFFEPGIRYIPCGRLVDPMTSPYFFAWFFLPSIIYLIKQQFFDLIRGDIDGKRMPAAGGESQVSGGEPR